MNFYVYILYSRSHDKYYIGQTQDLDSRLLRHNNGYENFTSKYIPWEIVWYANKPNRSSALALERKLKNLSRTRLEALIKKYGTPYQAGRDEP
ncbi:MAG TPA: GIY-YIG nuclease family protein [Chryseosolibacter sp.]